VLLRIVECIVAGGNPQLVAGGDPQLVAAGDPQLGLSHIHLTSVLHSSKRACYLTV